MLCAKNENNQIILATIAKKGVHYVCPRCHCKVILKQGQSVVPHFAHTNNKKYICNKGETYEHYLLKYMLAQWFELQHHTVVIEPYIAQSYQYPDLIVDNDVAIEIQFSKITILNIKKRSLSLLNLGFNVVWVINNPHYDAKTHILKLTTYERTYINLNSRHLFAWEHKRQQLYQYYIIRFLGGKRFVALRQTITFDTLLRITHKMKMPTFNLKLTDNTVRKYLKYCRRSRSVHQPILSIMYQLQLSETWIIKHLGIIFDEQLYVKSHPVYWQLQLLYMVKHNQYKLSDFIKSIEYNVFYTGAIDKEKITAKMVGDFLRLSYINGSNNVQN